MKIKEAALLVEGTIEGSHDVDIFDVSGAEFAKKGDLTFATDDEKLASAEKSETACILTTISTRKSSKPLIRVKNPKLSFLILYNAIHKIETRESFVHPLSAVSPSAKIGKNVWIGPHVCIEDKAIINDFTIIESGVAVGKNCSIGARCHIHPNVVLYNDTVIKDNVIIHSGTVIGSDGFGYVKDKGKIYKFPQMGRVIIENDVEIGANTAIDRGALNDTIIGAHSKIDNLCHIAHNVKTGKNLLMTACGVIAGSTTLGDDVMISGNSGITDNIKVGNNVVIGGMSCVIKDVEDNTVVWGSPARPIQQTKRQLAVLSWLTKNFSLISKILKIKE